MQDADPRSWVGRLSISRYRLARYQRVAGLLKLLQGYSPFPLDLELILTFRCNFACKMCILRQHQNLATVTPFSRPEMTLAEWKDVIDRIRASFFFRPNLNLTGGEPSLYRGYWNGGRFRSYRRQLVSAGTFAYCRRCCRRLFR